METQPLRRQPRRAATMMSSSQTPTRRSTPKDQDKCEHCILGHRVCDGIKPICGTCSLMRSGVCVYPEGRPTRDEMKKINAARKQEQEMAGVKTSKGKEKASMQPPAAPRPAHTRLPAATTANYDLPVLPDNDDFSVGAQEEIQRAANAPDPTEEEIAKWCEGDYTMFTEGAEFEDNDNEEFRNLMNEIEERQKSNNQARMDGGTTRPWFKHRPAAVDPYFAQDYTEHDQFSQDRVSGLKLNWGPHQTYLPDGSLNPCPPNMDSTSDSFINRVREQNNMSPLYGLIPNPHNVRARAEADAKAKAYVDLKKTSAGHGNGHKLSETNKNTGATSSESEGMSGRNVHPDAASHNKQSTRFGPAYFGGFPPGTGIEPWRVMGAPAGMEPAVGYNANRFPIGLADEHPFAGPVGQDDLPPVVPEHAFDINDFFDFAAASMDEDLPNTLAQNLATMAAPSIPTTGGIGLRASGQNYTAPLTEEEELFPPLDVSDDEE